MDRESMTEEKIAPWTDDTDKEKIQRKVRELKSKERKVKMICNCMESTCSKILMEKYWHIEKGQPTTCF